MNIEEKMEKEAIERRKVFRAQIELTANCNWRCRHCYIENYVHEGLKKEKIFDILKQLKEIGAYELVLTGGELFCRGDVFEIIEYSRKLGFKVLLFSNISLLDEEKIIKLKNLYVANVSCTIFSMKSEIHDYITQREGSLDKCLENLKLLKKYNIDVEVKTIVTSKNADEIEEIRKYCKENKFKYRIDYEIFAKTNGNKDPLSLRLSSKDFETHGRELDGLKGYSAQKHFPDEYACEQIRCYMFIDALGNVYPCEKFRYYIGNVNESSIKEIWECSSELKRIHNIKWKELPHCAQCRLEQYCQRCPGTAYMETQSEYDKYKSACERARDRYNLAKEIKG